MDAPTENTEWVKYSADFGKTTTWSIDPSVKLFVADLPCVFKDDEENSDR